MDLDDVSRAGQRYPDAEVFKSVATWRSDLSHRKVKVRGCLRLFGNLILGCEIDIDKSHSLCERDLMKQKHHTRFLVLIILTLILHVQAELGLAQPTESLAWEDRALESMTDTQIEDFLAGTDPADIDLADGETLAELLTHIQEYRPGLVYHPLDPCLLIDTRSSGSPLLDGQARSLRLVEGTRNESEEVSSARCSLPARQNGEYSTNAQVLLLTIQVFNAARPGEIFVWPEGHPVPRQSLLTVDPSMDPSATVTARLCGDLDDRGCEKADVWIRSEGTDLDIIVRLLGYYSSPDHVQNTLETLGGTTFSNDTAQTKSLASPFWEAGNVDGKIHYSDGFVGIGTASPFAPLHIQGVDLDYPNNKVLRINTFGESPNYRDHVKINGTAQSGYGIAFGGLGHHRGGLYARNAGGSSNAVGEMTLWSRSGGNIRLFGNTGVGVSNPLAKLHVGGNMRLNLGEGLLFQSFNSYWGKNLDARLVRIRDGNGSSGNVDGGLVVETWTEADNESFPLLTMRRNAGSPAVGIGSAYPEGPLRIHGYRNRGAGTLTSIGTTLWGTGTEFSTDLRVGSEIIVDGQVRQVMSVVGADQVEINEAFSSEVTDAGFWYTHKLLIVDNQGRMRLGPHEGQAEEQLQVEGNIKLSGNILSDGDICIGLCG